MNKYKELQKRIKARVERSKNSTTVVAILNWVLRECEHIEKLEIKLDKIIKDDKGFLLGNTTDKEKEIVKNIIQKDCGTENKKLMDSMIKKGKLEIIIVK